MNETKEWICDWKFTYNRKLYIRENLIQNYLKNINVFNVDIYYSTVKMPCALRNQFWIFSWATHTDVLTRHKDSHLSGLICPVLRAHIHPGVCPRHLLQTQNTGGGTSCLGVKRRNILLPLVVPGDVPPAGAGDGEGGVDGENYLWNAGIEFQTWTSQTEQNQTCTHTHTQHTHAWGLLRNKLLYSV